MSPEPGNPEPLFQVLRKDQVSGDSAKVYLKFMKDTKVPGMDVGWAWSFDPSGKWHQIDQDGVVSHAMPSKTPLCLHVPRSARRTAEGHATSYLLAARNVQAG